MAPVRALRLDDSTWSRMAASGSLGAAALMVGGAYLVLAFDRFGVQGFVETRAMVRFLLTGFYGWLGLAGGAAIVAAIASDMATR